MRAFGDGPRNFEPRSSDEVTPELAPPLLTTTPTGERLIPHRFNLHRSPLRRVFSGTGLELVAYQPRLDIWITKLPRLSLDRGALPIAFVFFIVGR
ncbi:hypothetical protein TNCV_1418701 [Trichonephila clavipes]|nr:hypothetical protein TNCV_1418701 [Trichonephila clavipes]